MKKNLLRVALCSMVIFSLFSCDKEKKKEDQKGQFAIAATSGDADYLLQTDNIDEGELTIVNNGIESSGTRNWMFYKNTVYSFIYSQSDPGKSGSYTLNSEGILVAREEFDLPVSITTRGYFEDYIVVANSTRLIDDARATFYFFDVDNQRRVGPFVFDTKELAGNGQMAYFTDVAQVGNQIYAPFKCVEGLGSTNTTRMKVSLFDTLWIAVYDYDQSSETMTYVRTIKETGRTGFIAGQTSSQAETGLVETENGDVYAFSSAPIDDSQTSKNLPSGVLRINNNETAFDQNYFFNIQQASNGYHLYRVWYMGDNIFALQMYSEVNSTSSDKNMFAIVNVATQTFNWVTGMPDAETITSVGKPYVDQADKYIAFGITTAVGADDTETYIYKINTNTAVATKGIKIISSGVSGIGKLTY